MAKRHDMKKRTDTKMKVKGTGLGSSYYLLVNPSVDRSHVWVVRPDVTYFFLSRAEARKLAAALLKALS
jgi:hypothetical protein